MVCLDQIRQRLLSEERGFVDQHNHQYPQTQNQYSLFESLFHNNNLFIQLSMSSPNSSSINQSVDDHSNTLFNELTFNLKAIIQNQHLYVGKELVISGWIKNHRVVSKSLAFLDLVDGSQFEPIQIIVQNNSPHPPSTLPKPNQHTQLNSNNDELDNNPGGIHPLTCSTPSIDPSHYSNIDPSFHRIFHSGSLMGVPIMIRGRGEMNQKLKTFEMNALTILYLGETYSKSYPIAKVGLPLEFLRQHPHFRNRTNLYSCVARIRSGVHSITHDYFRRLNFNWTMPPQITMNDCEGGGEAFQLVTPNPSTLSHCIPPPGSCNQITPPSQQPQPHPYPPNQHSLFQNYQIPTTTPTTIPNSVDQFYPHPNERQQSQEGVPSSSISTTHSIQSIQPRIDPTTSQPIQTSNTNTNNLTPTPTPSLHCSSNPSPHSITTPNTTTTTLNANHHFGQPVYLTVSSQLHLESLCHALKHVYCYQNAFRADHSNTTKHASEFLMLEVEMAFCNLEQLMRFAEQYFKTIIRSVCEQFPTELNFFHRLYKTISPDELLALTKEPFFRLTYTQAIELLLASKHTFEVEPVWGEDLRSEHERYLAEHIVRGPVFITHYPTRIKSFYMLPSAGDERVVECCDLLFPGVGEVLGGSAREYRYERLKKRMGECGLLKDTKLQWYLDLRKYGNVMTAGFGVGIARLLMFITGLTNIRDVQEFPRNSGSIMC